MLSLSEQVNYASWGEIAMLGSLEICLQIIESVVFYYATQTQHMHAHHSTSSQRCNAKQCQETSLLHLQVTTANVRAFSFDHSWHQSSSRKHWGEPS